MYNHFYISIKSIRFLKRFSLLCLTILVLSCVKDEIKVTSSQYVFGGIGTSQTTGTVEYNFHVPNKYTSSRVSIELVGNTTTRREIDGSGDQQLQFLNLPTGNYTYTFEFWALDANVGNYYDSAVNKLFSFNDTLEILNGKTLKIEVTID